MHHETKEEILDDFALEVKKIEEEAEQTLKDATAKKEEIIVNAKAESVTLITKRQAELEKKKEEKIKKQKETIDDDKKEIMKKGEKEVELMAKNSRKNIDKATDFVLNKLDEKIEEL